MFYQFAMVRCSFFERSSEGKVGFFCVWLTRGLVCKDTLNARQWVEGVFLWMLSCALNEHEKWVGCSILGSRKDGIFV
jgi:hypothetical protein